MSIPILVVTFLLLYFINGFRLWLKVSRRYQIVFDELMPAGTLLMYLLAWPEVYADSMRFLDAYSKDVEAYRDKR